MEQKMNTTEGAKKAPVSKEPTETAKKTKKATPSIEIKKNEKTKVITVRSLTGRDDEVFSCRINGVPYFIKCGVPVEVPLFLAEYIEDLAKRKKIAAQFLQKYAGGGASLGDLG